jgi:hypothetical protein
MAGFNWSFSKLRNYETCPKRHYHYDIIKDVAENQTSGPLKEGNDLHKAFERRVRDGIKLPISYIRHEKNLLALMNDHGDNTAEQKLAIDNEFRPVGFFSDKAWLRVVIDFCKLRERDAVVVDYKSGKPSDDESQLSIQAATVFHHIEDLEKIKSAYWFVNYDKMVAKIYSRNNLSSIWANILPRVDKLQHAHEEQEYPPRPSGLCIRYCGVSSCPYHGTGSR